MNKEIEFSDEIDLAPIGVILWKSTFFKPVKGIYLDLEEGSDKHLDAILDGTLENYLKFFE